MVQSIQAELPKPSGLRILIVDDDPTVGHQLAPLLTLWGHTAVIAEGSGTQLQEHAIALVGQHRCQIALVDMRLIDERDPEDLSGLKLVPKLKPAVTIIRSGFGGRKTTRDALKEYGAFDFVGREDNPRDLRAAIEDAGRSVAAGGSGPPIDWELPLLDHEQTPAQSVLSQLFPDRNDIPADEIEQLLGMLFLGKRRLALLPMAHDEASASPSLDTTLRRSSRIFEAAVKDEGQGRVVKLARKAKVEREVERYRQFVENKIPGALHTVVEKHAQLWDVGGIVYNHLGAADELLIFREFYHKHQDARTILRPLETLFRNWSHWYHNGPRAIEQSLFSAYDALWHSALRSCFEQWRREDEVLDLPGLGRMLPNPMRWVVRHHSKTNRLRHTQEAVTHGDLHSDNLFVNEGFAFLIDFERTGYGPILRDFVELIQDLSTRVAWSSDGSDTRPELELVYNLAVAWCAPNTPDAAPPRSRLIVADATATKLHEVVQLLQSIAHKHIHYADQRELLWGLLLNHLFVAGKLQQGSERWMRTVLFAAVICGRIERWGEEPWPPEPWPPVEWC